MPGAPQTMSSLGSGNLALLRYTAMPQLERCVLLWIVSGHLHNPGMCLLPLLNSAARAARCILGAFRFGHGEPSLTPSRRWTAHPIRMHAYRGKPMLIAPMFRLEAAHAQSSLERIVLGSSSLDCCCGSLSCRTVMVGCFQSEPFIADCHGPM